MSDRLAALLALAVAAPFIGSFLGVLILRLPRRRPVVAGRSSCDSCGHPLGPLDLIPLASFAALRGRCRYCGAAIDKIHPVVEIAALGIVLWAATVTVGWILAASCILGWMLLTLALIDIRTGLLPDALTLPLAALGLAIGYLIAPQNIADHLIGGVVGFALFAAVAGIYRFLRGREGLGFGDAKFLGAIGIWVAWQGLSTVLLVASIAGLAAAFVTARGKPVTAQSRIAFGAPLALAAWIVWVYGPLVL